MIHQHATIEDTVYFWFASNDTSGSGGDGATPLFDVREAGAAASAIPLLSGTPTLLTHANYPAGCHEIAVAATTANGFAADDTFSVFCTLAIDAQNPTGFVGSCTLTPLAKASALTTAQNDLDLITGADGATLATAQGLYAPSKAGDAMALTAAATSAQLVDDIYDEAESGHNVGGSFGKGFRQVKEGTVSAESTVNDAAATTTSFVTALIEATDNHYKDVSIVFIDGALAGQSRPILSYNGTTRAITLDEALTDAPANGDGFILKTDHVHPVSDIQSGLATEAKQDIIDANVDAVLTDTASIGVTKNTTFSNLEFLMVDATDHITPETGLTVTGQMSIDGGVFVAVNGAIAEVSNGIYQVDLTAADTNGDVITYCFSSAGAADRFITIKTRA